MDSRILEIVFCLMDYAQDSDDQIEDISDYSDSLKNLGYTDHEISTAYNWVLDHVGSTVENLYSVFPEQAASARVLTDVERARLTPEAHGFMLKLVNLGIMNGEQFEMVLATRGLLDRESKEAIAEKITGLVDDAIEYAESCSEPDYEDMVSGVYKSAQAV